MNGRTAAGAFRDGIPRPCETEDGAYLKIAP
jgi:hypothetical protein